MARTDRAVVPVVGSVLLVALSIALAAMVLTAAGAMADRPEPTPRATIEAEPIPAACAGCGPDDQVIRLQHVAGDTLSLADLELVLALPDRADPVRLVNLPLDGAPCYGIDAAHVEGADVFDGRCAHTAGAIRGDDGEWESGEAVAFRLQKSAVSLAPGEEVTLTVVHAPSNGVVAERTLSVVESS